MKSQPFFDSNGGKLHSVSHSQEENLFTRSFEVLNQSSLFNPNAKEH